MQLPLGEDIDTGDVLPRFRRIDESTRMPSQLIRTEPVTQSTDSTSIADPSVPETPSTPAASESSMQDYYELKRVLYLATIAVATIGFISAWLAYSRDTAFSYLIGSASGLLYLRMLSRDVERLGSFNAKLGNGRLAIFVGLIVVSTQVDRLQLLPVFLGFMTYKIATLIYSVVVILRESWQSSPSKL